MEKYLNQMDSILSEVFKHYSTTFSLPGVLLSGGIDSSTVALLVSRHFKDYELYSMGTDKTKDKEFVEIMSSHLAHGFTWVDIDKDKARENEPRVRDLLVRANVPTSLMHMSLAMGYFMVFQKISESGIRDVITGQGPDILLGGYHKYKSSNSVDEDIKKDLPLLEIDKRRDSAMAHYFGITLHNPYLEKAFVDFSLTIPQELKIRNNVEKFVLREYARSMGLPERIVSRPKKAFQYSTGLQKIMKNIVE